MLQGNVVLCGLRNGAVVTVDVREKQEGAYARHTRHRVPYPSHRISEASSRTVQKFSKQWFEVLNFGWRSYIILSSSLIIVFEGAVKSFWKLLFLGSTCVFRTAVLCVRFYKSE